MREAIYPQITCPALALALVIAGYRQMTADKAKEGIMTESEIELSKKILHAQEMALQTSTVLFMQSSMIELLQLRIEKLEAVVEGMCVGKG